MEQTLAELRLTDRLIDYDRIIEEKDVQIEKLLDDLDEAEGDKRLAQEQVDGYESAFNSTIEMIELELENIGNKSRSAYTSSEVEELLIDLRDELNRRGDLC